MILHIRELKYAMSASRVALTPICPPPSHHIGILMCGAGRFVSCIHCHLDFSFPAGADYQTVVKQFKYHSCSVPIPSNHDAPVESTHSG
jgi:hypothetical protein